MVRITDDFLEMGRSERGGWNRKQLALLGVTRPLRSGWKRRLIENRTMVSDSLAEKFLRLRKGGKKKQLTADVPILYVDGDCDGNRSKSPVSRRMHILVADKDGNVLFRVTTRGGSINIAEFTAVKEALVLATDRGWKKVHLYTDSCNNLAWWGTRKRQFPKVNCPELTAELKREIEHLKKQIDASISWVPREKNIAGRILEGNGVSC